MANRTLSYHEVTRPTLETRLARLRDCRSHGEQGLDDEVQTLCQALTAIDAISAENATLRIERDRALMESIRVDADNAMLREALELIASKGWSMLCVADAAEEMQSMAIAALAKGE